ncbi:MAG TPA: DUF1294 domain-containing protein [Candidatus Fimenecus excrementavium]|nr:DUF1294 domain-containing protein [Candidatus Fimenecus excrementavium]
MEGLVFFIWFILISAVSIIMTVYDKWAAKRKKRRVPERTLLSLGIVGGAAAMYLTMKMIRHKTKKKKFMVGLPLEILLHVLIVFCFYFFA